MNPEIDFHKLDRRTTGYLCLLALIPLFGLTFGIGNQIEQFSIVKRILDPAFAPADFFLNSAATLGQPRYYYALLLAWLSKLGSLEIVIHVMTVICGFCLGLTTYIAATRFLNASRSGAAVAATLVVLNHGISLGLAGYLTFSNFQPASVAITMSLAGITALALQRVWLATLLFILATVIHPTIGAELGTIGYFCVYVASILTGRRPPLRLWFSAFFVFTSGLIVFWLLPNIGASGEQLNDASFFSILIETRAPHHYLGLDFPKRRWMEATLFTASILWIALSAWRTGNVPLFGILLLVGLLSCIVVLCMASLYFVDIAQNRLWATAQLFRLVLLIKWVGYLLIGWQVGRWMITGKAYEIILIATIILPSADAISYGLFAAIVTRLLIDFLNLENYNAIFATVPAVLFAIFHQHQYGADDQTIRLVIACVALILISSRLKTTGTAAATILVGMFLIGGYLLSSKRLIENNSFRTTLLLSDRKDDATNIARLARGVSAPDSLWLVPPNLEQFRFVAERAVIVDFTSVPFEDASLLDWRTRLTTLYGKTDKRGFNALREMSNHHRVSPNISEAVSAYGAEYAVLYTETAWKGPVLGEAGKYKIVSLPTE